MGFTKFFDQVQVFENFYLCVLLYLEGRYRETFTGLLPKCSQQLELDQDKAENLELNPGTTGEQGPQYLHRQPGVCTCRQLDQ